MQAVTIAVVKNGYVVTEASVDSVGKIAENTGPVVRHVFPNIDDLKYWLTSKLDVPAGE
jgi:hypothetical protein